MNQAMMWVHPTIEWMDPQVFHKQYKSSSSHLQRYHAKIIHKLLYFDIWQISNEKTLRCNVNINCQKLQTYIFYFFVWKDNVTFISDASHSILILFIMFNNYTDRQRIHFQAKTLKCFLYSYKLCHLLIWLGSLNLEEKTSVS